MAKQKGRDLIIKRAQGTTPVETFVTIANFRSNGISFSNEQIDVTDKSGVGWKELLMGGIRSRSLSGAGVVSDDVELAALEAAANTGLIQKYSLTSGRGDSYVGSFQISSFERAGENGGEENFTCAFESSGEVLHLLGAPTVPGALGTITGPAAGGTPVTITGTNFAVPETSDMLPVITFGGVVATNVVVVSATSITCVTPAHVAGAVAVVIANPDGRSVTKAGAFTYT